MLEGFGFSNREKSDDYRSIEDWDENERNPEFPLWSIVGMAFLGIVLVLVGMNSY